jgi:hypothetical protein
MNLPTTNVTRLLFTLGLSTLLACEVGEEGTPADNDANTAEPIVFDVESMSSANGLTLVTLGNIETKTERAIFDDGELQVLESAEIHMKIPSDTVSFVVTVDNDAAGQIDEIPVFTSFIPPNGSEEVDVTTFGAYDTGPANIFFSTGYTTLLRPSTGTQEVESGTYKMKIALSKELASEKPRLRVSIRRGNKSESALMAMNLIFVEGNGLVGEEEEAVFFESSVLLSETLAAAGMDVDPDKLGIGTISDAVVNSVDSANYGEMKALVTARVEPDPQLPLIPGALNLYFVRSVFLGEGVPAYGASMGIPGILGSSGEVGSGVMIAVEAHREQGLIDFENFWKTVAHESGHWLGLRHTTETDASAHDVIADTPECSIENDSDGNGELSREECSGADGDYLMFWEGTGGLISPHQGIVMRHSPLAYPAP